MSDLKREAKIEQWLTSTLRALPDRQAPAGLRSLVLDEIARRTALPWWRSSFGEWPAAVRVCFVVLCVAIMAVSVLYGLTHQFGSLPLNWMHHLDNTVTVAGGVLSTFMRLIPVNWVRGGLLLGAVLYAFLFGLGAIAYRTLYLEPQKAGERS
jgi:hypothetical protein